MAAEVVERRGGRLVSFTVTRDGRTVRATVEKRARSILIVRIGALRRFAIATSTHDAAVR
jgi:hypothetical protein